MLTMFLWLLSLSQWTITPSLASDFSIQIPPGDNASWGTTGAYDSSSAAGLGLLVGNTFSSSTTSSSSSSKEQPSQCYVTVLDPEDRTIVGPQRTAMDLSFCMGGAVWIERDEPSPSRGGMAIVAGISTDKGNSQRQAFLQPIDGVGDGLSSSSSSSVNRPFIPLPPLTVPVAMASGKTAQGSEIHEAGAFFVAVHQDRDGLGPISYDDDYEEASNPLESAWAYWNRVSKAGQFTSDTEPKILKFDALMDTAEPVFTIHLNDEAISDIVLDEDETTTVIAGMQVVGSTLIVVGSTKGSGNDSVGVSTTNSDDWDGFVAFYSTVTGTQESEPIRIGSSTRKNDYIYNLCTSGGGGGAPDSDLYLVGRTDGSLLPRSGARRVGGAFVQKLNLQTKQVQWTTEIDGTLTDGLACVASDDVIYLGGQTMIDLRLQQEDKEKQLPPLESQAVFVTALSPSTGDIEWIQQLDSSTSSSSLRRDELIQLHITEQNNDHDAYVLMNSMDLLSGVSTVVWLDLDRAAGDHAGFSSINFGNGIDKTNTPRILLGATTLIIICLAVLLFSRQKTYGKRRRQVEEVLAPQDLALEHDLPHQDKELV